MDEKNAPLQRVDFAVNVTAISAVADQVSLTHVRPALPKTQTKLFLNLPVYSHDGAYLGKLFDGEIENFVLLRLTTDLGYTFPSSSITACRDAIFLRKPQPYPLGQRVPSSMLSQLQSEKASVTKPLLDRALRQGALIKLTLSLPPFSLLSYPEKQPITPPRHI
ncbi:MAG: hypothetical protein E7352_03860 [Clostridiales bacterium]|nr:hypothetical protein [Clostridiales bacterium]